MSFSRSACIVRNTCQPLYDCTIVHSAASVVLDNLVTCDRYSSMPHFGHFEKLTLPNLLTPPSNIYTLPQH